MAPLILSSAPLESALNPLETAAKRLGAFMPKVEAHFDRQRRKQADERDPADEQVTVKGLDLDALQRKYGRERAAWPKLKVGTFQTPVGISQAQFARIKVAKVRKYIEYMAKQGWLLCEDMTFQPGAEIEVHGRKVPIDYEGGRCIVVYPGTYPAYDVRDRFPRLDRRDYHVAAHFRFNDPKPLQIVLPPHLMRDRVLKAKV